MRMSWLFGRGSVRAPWIVAMLVLINALLLRAIDPPELSRFRDLAFDSYQRLKPRIYNPNVPVRIVDIDEDALAEYGQWPWPRTIVARLVDKLTEQGALVIAFDVVRCAQHLVPAHHLVQRPTQCLPIERAGKPHDLRHVVRRCVRQQPAQQPQPLLGEGKRIRSCRFVVRGAHRRHLINERCRWLPADCQWTS